MTNRETTMSYYWEDGQTEDVQVSDLTFIDVNTDKIIATKKLYNVSILKLYK